MASPVLSRQVTEKHRDAPQSTLQATPENAANIGRDIENGLYKEMHVN
jgi:hypothetical protein